MTQRVLTEAERERLRANLANAPLLARVERTVSSITPEQRLVLVEMVRDRTAERRRLHARMLDTDDDGKLLPWDQARWTLLSRELTMLYKALDLPCFEAQRAEISDADKAAFWHECQAQFAQKHVEARKARIKRKYEPRNDPSLAFGD